MEELYLKINCLYAETPPLMIGKPLEYKEVRFYIHHSNIWVSVENGWGFSIDRDMCEAILRKIVAHKNI